MKAFFFVVIYAFLLVAPASADEMQGGGYYLNLFEHPDAFRSDYKEVKYLPSLSHPLRSEGEFIYMKGSGLMWVMTTPFKMKRLITSNGLTQWVEGEKQVQPEAARQVMKPILANISAIFSGDFEALSEHFSFAKNATGGGGWSLALIPTSSYIKPYLQGIQIEGERYIERITITYAADRYTVATYTKPKVGITYITQEERALLDD